MDNNTEAYQYLYKIENGIREYLINLIRGIGIKTWTDKFVGKNHIKNAKEIGERIFKNNTEGISNQISDIYLYQLLKVSINEVDYSNESYLFHPFYYMTWNELENILRMKTNSELLSKSIGEQTKATIFEILKLLNPLRNDVAHSRPISDYNLEVIRTSYNQIKQAIPGFVNFENSISKELLIGYILKKIVERVGKLQEKEMMAVSELNILIDDLNLALNSFWVITVLEDLSDNLLKLKVEVEIYTSLRVKPGGLLQLVKWKRDNSDLLNKIKEQINESKI